LLRVVSHANYFAADGVISDGEEKSLYCFQTASLNSRTLCPAGSTHCYVRVEYFVSDKNDLTIQGYCHYCMSCGFEKPLKLYVVKTTE